MTEVTQQRIVATGRVESSDQNTSKVSRDWPIRTRSVVLADEFISRPRALDQIEKFANRIGPHSRALDQIEKFASRISPHFTALDQIQHAASSIGSHSRILDQIQNATNSISSHFTVFDQIEKIAKQSFVGFPRIDPPWIERFDHLIPSNLRGVRYDLDVVASIAFHEGIPLSWIPRGEIVVALIEADSAEARNRILLVRQSEILHDCDAALATSEHEWAVQCRFAVEALRHGHFQAAQSHASNIIYSIVATHPNSRGHALRLARRDWDEVPFQEMAPYLTLRPLDRTLVAWKPRAGNTPPAHFSRHATAHAVGHTGLFTPLNALIAVMLAVSLTIERDRGGWQQ